ncbi:MAG: hypothetical protein ACO307_00800 [Ilumatobacteraceae bacterium]
MSDPPARVDIDDRSGPSDGVDESMPSAGPLPRVGEVTPGWRIVLAIAWIAVALALAAVWNTSVQLGRSTWWLGPRGDPMPRIVRFVPFIAPIGMVFAAIENVRWIAAAGIAASIVTAAIGLGDLGRVPSIAAVELAIAGAGAAISIAALTGTYRARR